MQFGKFVNPAGTAVSYSIFEGKEVNEYNITITATPGGSVTNQVSDLRETILGFLNQHHLQQNNILFQRIFASDISNQAEELKAVTFCTAVSFVQQPPLSNAKISTWIVILQPVNANIIDLKSGENEVVLTRNGYSHGFRSVSYTHLRAHETRHDLVC